MMTPIAYGIDEAFGLHGKQPRAYRQLNDLLRSRKAAAFQKAIEAVEAQKKAANVALRQLNAIAKGEAIAKKHPTEDRVEFTFPAHGRARDAQSPPLPLPADSKAGNP